ncbi:glutamate synthase (NADPH), homotetrameric [Dissulfurispira thermophila]|uniref:Glutamate synthase (NADPH), homotetrameric n=2 Tax=root TaxID=1 RepID=A0A7G1H0F4_9BACT|nr:NADPH-dependent glutamate synthase [Dissulfurispira thermophila]BCB95633.1 glutamate synthase (NADPH), homotetrameric [Dissulfurispira thermophila]
MTENNSKETILTRTPIPEQDPAKRRSNFDEVALGYTPEMAMKEAARCLQCKRPLCIDGCPIHIPIPQFIKAIKEGNFEKAIGLIKTASFLPAVCGRVCPQEDQCEKNCTLGKKAEPVAIGYLERFAADYAMQNRNGADVKIPKPTGKKIAIVGSGPAGLTCAYELARLGHKITIFEALHDAGGVLVYGIPEFRLPKRIVAHEINLLNEIGVEIVTNAVVGKLITIDEIMEEFNACFIGTGAGLPKFMGIEGENLNGVYSANEFLTRANLMKAYAFPEYDTPIKIGKRVAVIGGGNVAMDAVRTALRLGAREAMIIYRRSANEMPARKEEIHHAFEEGVQFELLTSPVRIIGEDGWVKSVECVRMELGEPDKSGRRSPIAVKGSEFKIPVDVVIIAIGTGANPILPQSTRKLALNKCGYIIVDEETGQTSREGIFAGGDIVTGSATVILAMGAGKKAAKAIHEYLMHI